MTAIADIKTENSNFSLDTSREYGIIPCKRMPSILVMQYWKDVMDAGRLQARFCDVLNPDLNMVADIVRMLMRGMYFVFDPAREKIVGEFTLTDPMRKTAQVHFSVHPDASPQEALRYCRQATNTVLDVWGDPEKPDAPYLHSLYGLIPVPNKRACTFVQKVGFKKLGILPGAQMWDGLDFVDAYFLVKESKRVTEWAAQH